MIYRVETFTYILTKVIAIRNARQLPHFYIFYQCKFCSLCMNVSSVYCKKVLTEEQERDRHAQTREENENNYVRVYIYKGEEKAQHNNPE